MNGSPTTNEIETFCRDVDDTEQGARSPADAADPPAGKIMVANDDGEQNSPKKRVSTISFDSALINGCTVLHETPIVTRLVVRCDNGRSETNVDDRSLEDAPVAKTTRTTLYKCHLCCSICPSLHKMRCHLVFHCRKDSIRCSAVNTKPDSYDSDLESTAMKQEPDDSDNFQTTVAFDDPSYCRRTAKFQNNVAENLTVQKNRSNVNEVESSVKSESCSSDPQGPTCGGDAVPAGGNRTRSWSERMKDTPGMDGEVMRNSTANFDLTSRKRRFSINDDYRRKNSRGVETIDEPAEENERGKFLKEHDFIIASKFAQKLENNYTDNQTSNSEFCNESKFKSYAKSHLDLSDYSHKASHGPSLESNLGHPNVDLFSERCVFSQNGSPYFSPYYWLARQHWFTFAASNRCADMRRQEGHSRNPIHLDSPPKPASPCTASSEACEGAGNKREGKEIQPPCSLTPTSPRPSLDAVSPAPSPSKSSSTSADSASSPPAHTSFQLYNPLELVKVMRNFSAYPNLLPPVYPFLPLPSTLLNSPLDSRYACKPADNFAPKHDHLSDSDEASHPGTHISLTSASQINMPPTLSLDKSPPKNFYPYYSLLNFAPTANYNFPPKFIPISEADASAESPRLSSFNQSQYYKPLHPGDSNFAPLKPWPSPCDGKMITDPSSRKESKLLPFCKADKADLPKSSAKRGEACRPIKLADGRTVYHCSQCRKTFTNISDVNRHMDFHEDIRPFKCKFCSYYARTNSQLKVHMMRHQGIRQYVCYLCNYKGVTQSDLNRHTKSQIHVLKSRNECTQCSEGFVSPMNLAQHCKDRHHSSVT